MTDYESVRANIAPAIESAPSLDVAAAGIVSDAKRLGLSAADLMDLRHEFSVTAQRIAHEKFRDAMVDAFSAN